MKAFQLNRTGEASVLKPAEVPLPEPGPAEVRIRVRAIGINYAEILSRKGLYQWAPKRPYIPGMEACGEIDAVGAGVGDRFPGERVIVGTQYGSYAEFITVDHTQVLPAIDDFSTVENAAFPVNFLTAWVSLLELARMRSEDHVLVQAAGGGVGTAAVKLAKSLGCTVYGTAGSDEKVRRIRGIGADVAINYRNEDFVSVIRRAREGRGVDVVLESVGGHVYRKSLELLEPFGRLIVCGYASLDLQRWNPLSWWRAWRGIPRITIPFMGKRSIAVMSSHLGYLLRDRDTILSAYFRLKEHVVKHRIRPIVEHIYPFERLRDAHRLMESRKHFGKIVVRMDTRNTP